MSLPRSQCALNAARAVTKNSEPIHALVGFDGFIDTIIHIVNQRHSMAPDDYNRVRTIPEFAARCSAAAGKSANLEMVIRDVRFGGNGPLLSSALGSLGARVTYIGSVSAQDDWNRIDPIYKPLSDLCKRVVPICPPGHTDALEFDDGKIMLGKPGPVQQVTWDLIKHTLGADQLIELFDRVSLIAVVNWTLLAGVEGIWKGLCSDIFPQLKPNPNRRLFVDLSDPAKRTDGDISRAMECIQELERHIPVTLGLNLSESSRIADVIAVKGYDDPDNQALSTSVPIAAQRLRDALRLSCIVIHQHTGAGAADSAGESCWFSGPYTRTPKISTGAGDHFGGGFSYAQSIGLGLGECLAVACGVAGAYVRDGRSPTRSRLIEFLNDLPDPE